MVLEIIIFLLLSQLLLGIYLWYWVKDLYKYPNLLGFPIIGNLYYFYRGYCSLTMDDSYHYQKSIVDKFNDGMCFTLINGKRTLILSCPHLIEKIAYHPKISDKTYNYESVNPIMKGIFAYRRSDSEWKLRRKEFNSFVGKNNIESQYHDEFVRITQHMVENIAAKPKKVDVDYYVTFFTLDVVKATLCGVKELMIQSRRLHRATRTGLHFASVAMCSPVFGFIGFYIARVFHRLFLSRTYAIRKKVFSTTCQEVKKIEKNTTEGNKNLPLSLVIGLRNKKRNLTGKDLALELMEIVLVGSHTVAVALTGAIASLAVHPEIQEKAWKEQFEIFGTDTRDPTVEDIKNMHYLDRFLKEALRFFGVAQLFKETSGEINLDGIIVPGGICVTFLIYKPRTDPKYWKNPQIFDPERFLEEDNKPKCCYSPYGVGIRSCPGMLYSQYLMKVAISTLLRRFKISSTQKFEEFKLKMHLMTEISNLSCLQIEERNCQRNYEKE